MFHEKVVSTEYINYLAIEECKKLTRLKVELSKIEEQNFEDYSKREK